MTFLEGLEGFVNFFRRGLARIRHSESVVGLRGAIQANGDPYIAFAEKVHEILGEENTIGVDPPADAKVMGNRSVDDIEKLTIVINAGKERLAPVKNNGYFREVRLFAVLLHILEKGFRIFQ